MNHHFNHQSKRYRLRLTIQKTLQDIRRMIIEMFINDNILILYFH